VLNIYQVLVGYVLLKIQKENLSGFGQCLLISQTTISLSNLIN